MLVPYTVTAIAQVDVPTDINIISGALILLFDLDDNPVAMSDDALGTNPSTGKTTGTNGQKEIWINPGTYRLNVGGDDVRITVAPGSLSVEAVGELRTNLAKASPIYAPGDTVTLASTTNTGINRLGTVIEDDGATHWLDNGGSIITETGSTTIPTVAGEKVWLGDGWDGPQSILWYEAVAGTDCTTALTKAIAAGHHIIIPPTKKTKPFIVDGNIQLRDGQKITGSGGRPELSDEDASYVKFTDGSSFLTGDKASASSRIKVYCKDIYFIGGAGAGNQGVVGSGIAFDGSMGGRIESCTFDALEAAVENPWSFFITYSDIDVTGCDKGLDIDDSNACTIENFFARGTRRPISAGSDAARITLRDVSINMNDQVEIGIDVNGGVQFDGYTYIESFTGGSPAVNQTGIRYSSNQFSQRPAYLGNILIDNALAGMAYGIALDAENNVDTPISGMIENVKFSGTFSGAKIGYGIHNSSFPTLFLGVDVDSCPGLDVTDVVGSQPISSARIPVTSSSITATTSVAGASFLNIPLDDTVNYDNVDAFSTVAGSYRVRKTGYYSVSCVLQGDASFQGLLQINGVGVVTQTSISQTLIYEGLLTKAQTVSVAGRNGTNVTSGAFSARYISQGE